MKHPKQSSAGFHQTARLAQMCKCPFPNLGFSRSLIVDPLFVKEEYVVEGTTPANNCVIDLQQFLEFLRIEEIVGVVVIGSYVNTRDLNAHICASPDKDGRNRLHEACHLPKGPTGELQGSRGCHKLEHLRCRVKL